MDFKAEVIYWLDFEVKQAPNDDPTLTGPRSLSDMKIVYFFSESLRVFA